MKHQILGKQVRVVIDRALGSKHPTHDLVYPINYGYVEGILGGDGEEQDVYILGIDHPVTAFTGMIIAVVKRLDDVEEKWVAAPFGMQFTKEEIEQQLYFQECYFHHELICLDNYPQRPQAVIFDMDGLMIDSERVTFEGYVIECEKRGYVMQESFYRNILGLPRPSIYRVFREQFGEAFPIEEIIEKVHQYMAMVFKTKGVPIKPGLIELLTYLKQEGIKTMVATSSDRQRVDTILSSAKLDGYFNDSICGDEIKRGKPFPDVFLTACEKLGVSVEQAIVLEDSQAGIQASYAAGIPVICVPDMKQPDPEYVEKATFIMPSLYDILAYIKQLDA